ncbi:MAG: STAS domain-containing protein [Proteobacteria bacterium]|nr:STAS domain-containing protein [Pseudomonadota bacterium]
MRLASHLDLGAAAPLLAEFKRARRQPIEVDASAVERIGGLCLQALLAAEATWRADSVPFRIVQPSQSFVEALRLAGAESILMPEATQ